MGYRELIDEIVNEEAFRRVGPLLAFLIFILPIFFVWLLLRDGHTMRSRIIGFGWFAFWAFTPFYIY
jgi:hypothetical protein